jgi:AraC family transcriptional regulator
MAFAFDLYESPDLFFAELWCPPDDLEWGEDNQVTRPILALPATPVWQAHDGAERQLFNQNNVIFHHPGSEYRRERFRDCGYRCLFFFPSTSLLREVMAGISPALAESTPIRFPASGPLDGRTFGLSRLAARYLRSPGPELSAARELLYEVLGGAARASILEAPARPRVSSRTLRARREIVEEAKEILTSRVAERLSLDGLANSLHTSPYHLARIFRGATGFSVHGYLVNLRLRMGMEGIHERRGEIGDVGLGFGFSSHSHFTASFRRAFGLTPSGMLSFPPGAMAN